MNRLALRWLDTALALEEENRELRRLLTALIFWMAQNEELFALARREIERRWP